MTATSKAPDFHSWAARTLNLPANSSNAEARSAFLRELSGWNFLPPVGAQVAFQYRSNPNDPSLKVTLAETAYLDEETRLREEAKTLARELYSLPPDERRRRWQAVIAQCRWSPRLEAYLECFEHVLNLEVKLPEDDPDLATLIQEIQCEFLEPPREEAIRRLRFLQKTGKRPSGPKEPTSKKRRNSRPLSSPERKTHPWQPVAVRLRERYPQIAELAPTLLAELTFERDPGLLRLPSMQSPVPQQQQQVHHRKQSGFAGWGWVAFGVFIVIKLLVLAFSAGR